MLTISTGYSVRYLTEQVAAGRENYYTGAVAAGEPSGRWYGTGAETLGLSGLVDEQDMTAVYERFIDPRDLLFKTPAGWDEASTLGHTGRRYASEEDLYKAALDAEPTASPERRGELRLEAGKKARRNVAFLDATFSVQKSVTVLHTAFEAQEVRARAEGDETAAAAWSAHKTAVEAAIWAGNQAALDYLTEKAGYSRIGHHGGAAGRFLDAHDWVVASFFQHDSRDHDPQLHIHNAILNRVQGADGQWRTLDSKALHKFRGAAAAVGERTMEEHLTATLGVRFAARPDGKAREIVGIASEVSTLFSSRRRAITPKTAKLVEAFEAKFGREPNSLEMDRLQRQATFATRKAKSHVGESVEQRLARWDEQLRAEVAGSLAQVADDVLALAGEAPAAAEWSAVAVIETALAAVQAKKAAWTAPDLTRAISDVLPDHLGRLDGTEITRLLDGLTEQALRLAVPLDAQRPGDAVLPDALRLANGQSAYQAPGQQLYATPEHVRTERLLRSATARGGAPALSTTQAAGFVHELAEMGIELGADQAAAVRGVLTSGTGVECLVGPAGTGKSFVVGALAKAWTDPALWDGQHRRVVGLAASQIATEVLVGEGLDARNIARWLATQARLDDDRAVEDDEQWRLRQGDLVVVDESAMADTASLAQIHDHVRRWGAKLLLTGDHHQLAAVGAGGGMELMAEAGAAYELTEARRFTHGWERDASLRLRAGDESVLGDYHKHGRLLDAGTREEAEASAASAWLADTLAGDHALLIVDTNEQAARLSADLRAELVRLGKVAEHGVPLGLQGTYAGVGDLVQARLNGWHLAGHEGNRRGPINREQYRVLDTRDDGGLVVAPVIGRGPDGELLGEPMTLPAEYVGEHVALGYACTVHSVQGLTVDRCHALVTAATSLKALYVALTRGKHGNTAHVTTVTAPEDPFDGTDRDAVHRSPAAVVGTAFETSTPQRSALATATESQKAAESVRTAVELLADGIAEATAGRTSAWLDQLVDDGHLTGEQRARLAAEDGGTTLTRILRRAELAGHDPQQVLETAVASRPLAGARQLTNVLHARISGDVSLEPVGDHFTDWTPRLEHPQWQDYLTDLADQADQRRRVLADQAATEQPPWVVEAFGPPPADPDGLAWWKEKAGVVAAHRELTGHTDEATPVGLPPKPGQVEAYASWRAAWRALGRPEDDRKELELSDGQLRVRIRAYQREEAWAPPFVGEELAGTSQAAAQQRHTAALRRAEAAAATEEQDRQRLEREAHEAAALADTLEQQAAQLAEVDNARSTWLAHTAATRAAADRAQDILDERQAAEGREDEHTTTAADWLAAHQADLATEDQYRAITDETDLADVVDQHTTDLTADERADGGELLETAVPDIRDTTANEPAPLESDVVRVPTADETSNAVTRARRALLEIHHRRATDTRTAEDSRAEQLARWRTDDLTSEQIADRTADHDTPALDLAGSP